MARLGGARNLGKVFFERIASGEWREAIEQEQGTLDEQDARMIEGFEIIAEGWEESEEEPQEEIMAEKDWLWFLSLTAFALYAYLDVYSRALIDLIAQDKLLLQRLEEYLDAGEALDNRPESLSALKSSSIKKRMHSLVKALEIDEMIAQCIDPDFFQKYSGAFSKFMRIRNKVTHSNPRMDAERYAYSEFKSDLDELRSVLEDIEKSDIESDFLREMMEGIEEYLLELSPTVGRLLLIVKMATIYPALIDCVISVLLST